MRFSRIWPAHWADMLEVQGIEEMVQEWSIHLSGLDGGEIAKGIDQCARTRNYPPSIAEFLKACKGLDEDWQHRSPAYRIHNPAQLLTRERTPEEKRAGVVNLAEMRKKLRGE